jgi:hypothetical protein
MVAQTARPARQRDRKQRSSILNSCSSFDQGESAPDNKRPAR